MNRRVIMEMSEKQARTILAALEEYFRLRMGQAGSSGLADDLAFSTYDRSKDSSGKGFDLAIQCRDNINHVLSAIFHIAWPIYGTPPEKTELVLISGEIWSQLRWELSSKEPYMTTPFQLGPEKMPVITILQEEAPDVSKTNKKG